MKPEKLSWHELSRNEKRLYIAALEVRKKADVPISGIAVGGAVLTDIGNVYSAPNDESMGMSRVMHAAEAAIREKKHARLDEEIVAVMEVAVLGKYDPDNMGFPCASCRQAIWDEIRNPELMIYGAGVDGAISRAKLKFLYPYPSPSIKKRLSKKTQQIN